MNRQINLLYTCDDAYLPLVSISLASFIDNNVNTDFKVYIATEKDEHTSNYKRLTDFHNNIHFSYINCRKYDNLFKEKDLNKWGSNSYYVYWRIVAPEIIDCDYLYYIDTDIICLKEIENPIIGNMVCGLVLDSVHSIYNKRLNEINTNLYNTGVMYIDVNKWRDRRCTLKCLDFIRNDKRKLLLADQDIISLALKDDVYTISPKYNYFSGYDYYGVDVSYDIYELDKKTFYPKNVLKAAKKEAIFYHALGGVFGRPWEKKNANPINIKYKEYISKSGWKNFSKPRNKSFLFRLESFAEIILPKKIYINIHKIAIKIRIIINT